MSASAKLMHSIELPILGTMTMGKQLTEAQSHSILDSFVDKHRGVWIDCAEIYPVPVHESTRGHTEQIVGNWLKLRVAKDAKFRSKIALASKVAGPSPSTGYSKREAQDFTKTVINQALEESLQRMNTTYLDLYQLHWPSRAVPLWGEEKFTQDLKDGKYGMRNNTNPPVPFDDIVATMGELLAEGKILSWGLSNETAFGLCQFAESSKRLGVLPPLSLQQDFSLLDRRADGALAECLFHLDIKFLSYGPLAGGTLTGKYMNLDDDVTAPKRIKLEACRHLLFPKFQARYHSPAAFEATSKYAIVAKKHGLTLTQLALGFCATRHYMANGNGGVIFGANDLITLDENMQGVVDASKFWTEQIEQDVLEVHQQRPNPNVLY
ncbi:hypothetical protein BASA81_003364 [Batrachochytrium salamandrivorans]|nr:hypothetical protein BASA81_003364 [Batrachochytrium salamandrivorans]